MPFNTRNPIPSGDLRDLDDNARNIDVWVNDKTKLSHPDRFGVERRTWHGIEQKAQLDLADAVADATAASEQARDQAIDAKNAAQEAAMMSGFSKYADTLAQLESGIGTDYVDGDVVMVFQDESRGDTSSIFKIESGAAEFKQTFDKTRQDLLSFTGTISADAEWSDVPAHSDPAFDAQAQALANRTEIINSAVLSYPDYAAASAAAATLPDGQNVTAQYDAMAWVVSSGNLTQEQSVYRVNDYAKIRNFDGRGTRQRVSDKTGTYWWVRQGSAADNGGTVLADALGRSWVREYSGAVNVLWFGAHGNYDPATGVGDDDIDAFQRCSDYCAQTCKKMFVPQPEAGYGYVFKAHGWDLTSHDGVKRQGINIEFENRSSQYNRGTIIYGETGSAAMVDVCGTDGFWIKNIGLKYGKNNRSTVGILQARTAGAGATGWAGDAGFIDPYVDMGSVPTANGGLGTLGIVDISGEETRWENPQVWANTPLVISWSKNLIKTDKALGDSTDNFSISSEFVSDLVTGYSNTVFAVTGMGRFIAYDFISPCVLINAAGTVDLGHSFMQKRDSGELDVIGGTHCYPVEVWGGNQLRFFGAVENCGTFLLNRRGITSVDANVRLSDGPHAGNNPLFLQWEDGGTYSGNVIRMVFEPVGFTPRLVGHRRHFGVGVSEPMKTSFSELELSTTGVFSSNAIDKKFYRNTSSGSFKFKGRTIKIASSGNYSSGFSANIGDPSGVGAVIASMEMPAVLAGLSSLGAVVKIEGVATNATSSGTGSPSSISFSANFSISVHHSTGAITCSLPQITFGDAASVNESANKLTGLTLEVSADNTTRVVTLTAKPTETGANQASVLVRGVVSIATSTGYKEGIALT